MKVHVWPADDGGCGHYRMIWPARALAAQGADIHIEPPSPDAGCRVLLQDQTVAGRTVARTVRLVEAPDADVVVMQRPLAAARADLVPLLQQAGIAVVIEIDDDFETIHPRNSSFRSTHPKVNPGWNRQHLARACRDADLVVCTTPALAHRYARHGRTVVVPNHVPARYLHITVEPGPLHVGWTGSVTETHPTDLQVTRGAVGRVLAETGVPFAVVGTGVRVQDALGLDRPPLAAGWVSIEEYPQAMAQIGIGIVPLDDIAFNHAKSCLKMAEFAALGVPVIATPTPDNTRLHGHGVGLLAAKPKHWASQLRRLIADPDERACIAEAGRAAMRGLTIEGNAGRWWDAWTAPLTVRSAA